jgi:glycosyltransferase involved in cell wall biosynthesis
VSMISVIVATYNWPQALRLSLESLKTQTDRNFEVIIADDGSRSDTRELIESMRADFPVPMEHVWIEDDGFRKTVVGNLAIAASKGDYLIFIDGDCIVQPDFITQHRRLAEPGHMVTGSRILSDKVLAQEMLSWSHWSFERFKRHALRYRLRGGLNKLLPLLVKFGDHSRRLYSSFVWRRIKGCNMACWRSDARAIGGFDESLLGWGHEDADFVFRLQAHGVIRKSGAWATEVIHIFHQVRDQSNDKNNRERLNEKIRAHAALNASR